MADWKQTFCILCYVNCGREVATEGGKITRVRGDRANQRSQGYLCQKPHPAHDAPGPRRHRHPTPSVPPSLAPVVGAEAEAAAAASARVRAVAAAHVNAA